MLFKRNYFGAVLVFMFICCGLYAQTGKINGKVIDAKTGETLPGASVLIEGTSLGAASDFDGNYSISHLKAGTYTLVCKYVSYSNKVIKNVEVKEGDITYMNISLEEPSGDTLTTVTITATLDRENTSALLIMQKNSATVGDGISAETIKRTPDRNTSDVLRRVSGAAIQDNRFAIIRGLNDRYNAAYLNGTPLPSSESDRKAFSFDIFPSALLDNLVIVKTASPDLPGEFAGGIIQINTKSIPDKNFYSLSTGAGYNTITTGKEQVYYKGGKTDWLGTDDGTRALPAGISSVADYPTLSSEQAAMAKYMKNDWALLSKKFAPNTNYQFSLGHRFDLKNSQLGVVLAATYNRNLSFFSTERNTYTSNIDPAIPSQIESVYADKTYSTQTLSGLLGNMAFKINDNHQVSFKNLYSINADDRVIARTGTPTPLEANPLLLKSTARWFTGNQIYSSQLSGDHFLPATKIKILWVGGLSTVKRVIPDGRISRYTRLSTFNDPYDPYPYDTVYTATIDNANVGPDYGGYIFNAVTNEKIYSFKADLSYHFELKKIKNEIKAGGLYQLRERDFAARQLGFLKYGTVGGGVNFKDSLLYLGEDQIFSNQNMGLTGPNTGGFKLKDATKPNDSYDARSKLAAAFIMLDHRYKEWLRVVWGVRVEQFNQQLNSRKLNKEEVHINTLLPDALPSANVIFSVSQKQNIRAAYSQTLNRPEFRELAPFAFYEFNTQFVYSGNDTLKRAKIHNYDLRYELYPGKAQLFSATGFYKYFADPIEQVSRHDVQNEITFRNVPRAKSYGAELEYRVLLGTLLKADSSAFLNKLTLFTNYSYIVSKVDVSSLAGTTMKERPLQGQSPYIFNAGILYNDPDRGFSFNAAVNRVGTRIAIVGNVNEPDLWENGRTVLDVQLGKAFWKNRLDVKLNARDVLAQKQYFFQDRNGNRKLDLQKDDLIWVTNFGRTFSFNVTLKF